MFRKRCDMICHHPETVYCACVRVHINCIQYIERYNILKFYWPNYILFTTTSNSIILFGNVLFSNLIFFKQVRIEFQKVFHIVLRKGRRREIGRYSYNSNDEGHVFTYTHTLIVNILSHLPKTEKAPFSEFQTHEPHRLESP